MEIAILELLTVAVVLGFIVREIVKLNRDPELNAEQRPPRDREADPRVSASDDSGEPGHSKG